MPRVPAARKAVFMHTNEGSLWTNQPVQVPASTFREPRVSRFRWNKPPWAFRSRFLAAAAAVSTTCMTSSSSSGRRTGVRAAVMRTLLPAQLGAHECRQPRSTRRCLAAFASSWPAYRPPLQALSLSLELNVRCAELAWVELLLFRFEWHPVHRYAGSDRRERPLRGREHRIWCAYSDGGRV